jgi:outer membrane protein OmpA-like peptidoglycan-associated protein
MKNRIPHLVWSMLFLMFMGAPSAHGQFIKKLAKSAQRAAERTVENRVNREASKKTDQVLDSLLQPGSAAPDNKVDPKSAPEDPMQDVSGAQNAGKIEVVAKGKYSADKLEVYSKFDFVRGEDPLFFDDFSDDFIGDFPSKWDTDGNGEIVSLGGSEGKWFELKGGSLYFPQISELPAEYTIEFDVRTSGFDNNTSSTAKMGIGIKDERVFKGSTTGNNLVYVTIPYCQYIRLDMGVQNRIDGEQVIGNGINSDFRKVVLNEHHIAIAVNEQRFRMWINETKYLDIPRLVPAGTKLKQLLLEISGMREGVDRVFVKNIRVDKGGVDLRRKLIADGSVSTNGILFDSGSANLQPESMGIIRQIAQVLEQESGMKLEIVGHTDSDGADASNQSLSEARANAVKNALTEVYQIDASRLTSSGKGESVPVADNTTPEGKAKNRRVEFIKR